MVVFSWIRIGFGYFITCRLYIIIFDYCRLSRISVTKHIYLNVSIKASQNKISFKLYLFSLDLRILYSFTIWLNCRVWPSNNNYYFCSTFYSRFIKLSSNIISLQTLSESFKKEKVVKISVKNTKANKQTRNIKKNKIIIKCHTIP